MTSRVSTQILGSFPGYLVPQFPGFPGQIISHLPGFLLRKWTISNVKLVLFTTNFIFF